MTTTTLGPPYFYKTLHAPTMPVVTPDQPTPCEWENAVCEWGAVGGPEDGDFDRLETSSRAYRAMARIAVWTVRPLDEDRVLLVASCPMCGEQGDAPAASDTGLGFRPRLIATTVGAYPATPVFAALYPLRDHAASCGAFATMAALLT